MADWTVRFERGFEREFKRLAEDVQDELMAHADVLERKGPGLGRPVVDTLKNSAYPNMKELRFGTAGGVWRVAFAFDPESRGILLVAGNKIGLWGRDEVEFYTRLIAVADARFKAYLTRVAVSRKALGRAEVAGTRTVPKPRRVS